VNRAFGLSGLVAEGIISCYHYSPTRRSSGTPQKRGAPQLYVEAVEKPIFHPEIVVKMAKNFLRHLHFIN
jgi:hypothetical protein